MDINKQVNSYEQGCVLKELGIANRGHLFSWVWDPLNERYDISKLCVEALSLCGKDGVPAFTSAELGCMLNLSATGEPTAEWWNQDLHGLVETFRGAPYTEAHVRAELLSVALIQGYLKVDEANERLLKP